MSKVAIDVFRRFIYITERSGLWRKKQMAKDPRESERLDFFSLFSFPSLLLISTFFAHFFCMA